jgi:hypothetical protein
MDKSEKRVITGMNPSRPKLYFISKAVDFFSSKTGKTMNVSDYEWGSVDSATEKELVRDYLEACRKYKETWRFVQDKDTGRTTGTLVYRRQDEVIGKTKKKRERFFLGMNLYIKNWSLNKFSKLGTCDAVCRRNLAKGTGMKVTDVPDDLVGIYRQNLLLHRAIREQTKQQKHEEQQRNG